MHKAMKTQFTGERLEGVRKDRSRSSWTIRYIMLNKNKNQNRTHIILTSVLKEQILDVLMGRIPPPRKAKAELHRE